MIKKLLLFTTFFFVLGATIFAKTHIFRGETLTAAQVKKRWGDSPFDIKKFKEGSYEDKASMSYSIMTNKGLIGKSDDEIRNLFGPHDGYYLNDSVPSYIIQRGKNHSEETWQLVFWMDQKDKLINIIMHKNCCEKED